MKHRSFALIIVCQLLLLLVGLSVLAPHARLLSHWSGTQQGGGSRMERTLVGQPGPGDTVPTHVQLQSPPGSPNAPKPAPSAPAGTGDVCTAVGSNTHDLVLNASILSTGISLHDLIASALSSGASPLIQALCGGLDLIGQWTASQSFLFSTGAGITYNQATVQKFWGISLGFALSALALVLLVGGHQVMAGAPMRSVLPRIILTAVALAAVYPILSALIEIESAMSSGMLGATLISTPGEQMSVFSLFGVNTSLDTGNVLNLTSMCFLMLMAIAVSLQMLARIALLDVLIVISPIALLCYALPAWQRWANLWVSAFVATLFVQFFQVVAMGLGADLITTLGGPAPLGILVGIAVLFLVLKIPGWLGSAVTSTLAGVPNPYTLALGAAMGIGTGALQVLRAAVAFGSVEV